MNIERAMEFIIENLASVTAKQEKAETQMLALRKIVVSGMKMVVDIQKAQKRTDKKIAELADGMAELAEAQKELVTSQKDLAASQKETDRRFNQWLDSSRGTNGHKGANGHKKKPN